MLKGIKFVMLLTVIVMLSSCGVSDDGGTRNTANTLSALDSAKGLTNKAVSDEELALYAPEMRRIYEQGELRVAVVSSERKPFFYEDLDGVLVGHDIDLATDIADKFGIKVRFIRTANTFEEVVNQVAAGEADLAVSKLSATLMRAKKVSFSKPYMTLHQGVLINRLILAKIGDGNQQPLTVLQSANTRIGVIAGTSYVEFAKEVFPYAETVSFQSTGEAMDAALQGEISAIFYDELQLTQLIKNNPEHNIDLQLAIIPDQVDPLAVAVSLEDPALLAWIDLYLDSNQAWISQLASKYDIELSDKLFK